MTDGSDDESSEAFPASYADDVTTETCAQCPPTSYRSQHALFLRKVHAVHTMAWRSRCMATDKNRTALCASN
jgi:hypothetical protein